MYDTIYKEIEVRPKFDEDSGRAEKVSALGRNGCPGYAGIYSIAAVIGCTAPSSLSSFLKSPRPITGAQDVRRRFLCCRICIQISLESNKGFPYLFYSAKFFSRICY